MPACCCITSPHLLIAMPSCRLDAPAGCRITSRCPHVSPPSCQLVAPACCRIASPCPLVASHAALSFSRRAGWLLRCLSRRRPLVVSLSRCLVASSPRRIIISSSHRLAISSCRLTLSRRARWLSHHHHHLLSSSSCTTLSSSHCAGWLLHCLSLRHPRVLLS